MSQMAPVMHEVFSMSINPSNTLKIFCGFAALLMLSHCDKSVSSSSTPQSVDDIAAMHSTGVADEFWVTCNDGTRERASSEQIRNDEVCNGAATSHQLYCVAKDGGFVPANRANGQTLGFPVGENDCRRMVARARSGVVCTLVHGGFAPMRVSDSRQIGYPFGIEECLRATDNAFRGAVCSVREGGGFVPFSTKRTQPAPLGFALGALEECLELTREAKSGAVCANVNGFYSPIRLSDGGQMGEPRPRTECLAALRDSRYGIGCVGRNGMWITARFRDGQELGHAIPFEDCRSVTSAAREGVVCVYEHGHYAPTIIRSALRLGQGMYPAAACNELILAARNGVTCANTNGYYAPHRTTDGGIINHAMEKRNCLAATQASNFSTMCSQLHGAFFQTRIVDGSVFGNGMPTIEQCISTPQYPY
jgi:hypothetical protein